MSNCSEGFRTRRGGEFGVTTIENYCFGSIIDGKPLESEHRVEGEVRNPYTDTVLSKVTYATAEDVENAVTRAHRVYTKVMKKMPTQKRADILRKTAELVEREKEKFARLLSSEGGKPLKGTRADLVLAAQVLRFASQSTHSIYEERISKVPQTQTGTSLGLIKRISLGVVAINTPANFSIAGMLLKLAPAIAAGNVVVLNPSIKTPLSTGWLYRLFEKAGLPKGVINIVVGHQLVAPLVHHPKVKVCIMTRTVAEKLKIKDTKKKKVIWLDWEIKNPTIVFNDADVDFAVTTILNTSFAYNAPSYAIAQQLIVHEDIYSAFQEKLLKKVALLKWGDPLEEETDIGPLLTIRVAEQAEAWLVKLLEQGATLLAGGKRQKSFMEPTIINGHIDEPIKTYAPVLSLTMYSQKEEIRKYKGMEGFILHAGVFTGNHKLTTRREEIMRVMEKLTEIKLTGKPLR